MCCRLRWGSQVHNNETGETTVSDLPSFDELLTLAKNNPEALEALRQQHINMIIDNADPKHQARLRGLQFQIDAQRGIHADSPMGSCMKISKMMQESFADLRGWLNQVSGLNDPLREVAESQLGSHYNDSKVADILAFPSN